MAGNGDGQKHSHASTEQLVLLKRITKVADSWTTDKNTRLLISFKNNSASFSNTRSVGNLIKFTILLCSLTSKLLNALFGEILGMKVLAGSYQVREGLNIWVQNLEKNCKTVCHCCKCTIRKRQWMFCQGDLIFSANTPHNLISLFFSSNRGYLIFYFSPSFLLATNGS